MMKSLGAAVRISNGTPPASRTASLTTFAIPSRWLKQIASSDEELTTAILGLRRSSSVRPRAFHCARRTASRGEPGSKLLRRAFGIKANLSQHMLLKKAWYGYYVLALLTLCYVANVVDRSQVLAASLQAIKKEFSA